VLRSVERLALAHGACVLVEIEDHDAALAALAAVEQHRAAELGPLRGRELIAGRTALHLALGSAVPILSDDRGAPVLPPGWVGSVSHKGSLAAALVAPAGAGHIGVDLELAAPPRQDIARRILTPREQAALPDRGRAVTLRFAIKEAIYKAVDPYVRRYVGFTEVELELAGNAVAITTALPLAIEASWREHAGHWLATARAVPRLDR
jgi:4'-phosphopantetheinyl transferase EntD